MFRHIILSSSLFLSISFAGNHCNNGMDKPLTCNKSTQFNQSMKKGENYWKDNSINKTNYGFDKKIQIILREMNLKKEQYQDIRLAMMSYKNSQKSVKSDKNFDYLDGNSFNRDKFLTQNNSKMDKMSIARADLLELIFDVLDEQERAIFSEKFKKLNRTPNFMDKSMMKSPQNGLTCGSCNKK